METESQENKAAPGTVPVTNVVIIVGALGAVILGLVIALVYTNNNGVGGAGIDSASTTKVSGSAVKKTATESVFSSYSAFPNDDSEPDKYLLTCMRDFCETHNKDLNADRYIVHMRTNKKCDNAAKTALASKVGAECKRCFHHCCDGFVAHIHNEAELYKLKSDTNVRKIERDMRVLCTGGAPSKPQEESPAPAPKPKPKPAPKPQTVHWGVPRVGADHSSTRTGNGSGSVDGVDVYILDSGCSHPDLNIVEYVNFVDGEPDNEDLNGHGTHVAGIVCAKDNSSGVAGIAPGARLHSIKVLGADGSGFVSDVVAGIEYVIEHRDVSRPAVMNLSLGMYAGSITYTTLDVAVKKAVEAGITVTVAAGNDAADASLYSPAHVSECLTVAAYDANGYFASFSNFGSLVDLCAPGVGIISLWTEESTKTISGTSMAAPVCCGAAALYLSKNPSATPAQVRSALLAASDSPSYYVPPANNPEVSGVPANTTAKSVFVGSF